MVLWQFFNGTLRTRKIVSSQLTQPYAGRIQVLQDYVNWRTETKAKESAAYKEINAEYIEVDESTIKQIEQMQQ